MSYRNSAREYIKSVMKEALNISDEKKLKLTTNWNGECICTATANYENYIKVAVFHFTLSAADFQECIRLEPNKNPVDILAENCKFEVK